MKNRRCIRLLAFAALLGAVCFPFNSAFADLILVDDIEISGTGLGAVNTLITIQATGQDTLESGCINQDGSFTPCLFGVLGGDNTAINAVLSFSNDTTFAAVVNINETGQDVTVTLTHLYLTFVGDNGSHTAMYTGEPIDLTAGTGTGTGQSGFVFRLDEEQTALVAALGANLTVSGGMEFADGSTGAGPETLHVIQIPTTPVPEPTSLLLLGTGLVGLGWFKTRRAKH